MFGELLLTGLLIFGPVSFMDEVNAAKLVQASLSDKDKAGLDLMEYLISEKFPPHLAAGFVGNASQESDLDASASGSSGKGYCQWCGGRRRLMEKKARERKTSWEDPKHQAWFINYEVKFGTEKESFPLLLKARDADHAAILVNNLYERPSKKVANLKHRRAEARRFYSLWEKTCKTRQSKDLVAQK